MVSGWLAKFLESYFQTIVGESTLLGYDCK